MAAVEDIFHPVVELPEPVRAERYRRLVGLDDIKDRLRREAQLLADPTSLRAWSVEHHGAELPALALFADRGPLFMFAGDVGAGKSALAWLIRTRGQVGAVVVGPGANGHRDLRVSADTRP